ncbi:MFS transporter [Candidatus Babeliales bacterium]|nr:MFS transporter [Candidatus Babeliales bacterium]
MNGERRKFTLLASIFSLAIGVYWLFRPIKDSIFLSMIGGIHQPKAKMLSIVVVGCFVLLYSKLVDKFERHKLLYGFSLFYAVATACFAFFIWHPTIGMSNVVASPDRYLGWAFYLFVESFGSVMVALFWSFVSDTTTPESAKRGYFMIAIGGQSGGFLCPLIAQQVAKSYGTGIALIIPVIALFVLVGLVYCYMTTVPKKELKGFTGGHKAPLEGKTKPGFFEGIRLVFTKPYLAAIFTIVVFYEIVITILDYHFKMFASEVYIGEDLTNYLFSYALWTNGVALVCLFFGVGSVGRRLGLGKTILLLPILVASAVILLYSHPLLPIAFAIMVSCKGLNYALIQPSKEQLYIPTSKESKYKAKAWIDMFGSRSSKGMGSFINSYRETMPIEVFASVTACLSLGLIGVWIVAALFVGRVHAQAIKEERIVC